MKDPLPTRMEESNTVIPYLSDSVDVAKTLVSMSQTVAPRSPGLTSIESPNCPGFFMKTMPLSNGNLIPLSNGNAIPKVTEKDVVLTRSMRNHKGNKLFHAKIAEVIPQYEELGTKKLADIVIKFVENEVGGRFLEMRSKGWFELEKEKKQIKVARSIQQNFKRQFGRFLSKPRTPKEGKRFSFGHIRNARNKAMEIVSRQSVSTCVALGSQTKTPREPQRREDSEDASMDSVGKKPKAAILKTPKKPPKEFVYEQDPNEYYVEETAHKYHNPPSPNNPKYTNCVNSLDLRPIPPPSPLPPPPESGSCSWSFDEENRVLIADFSVRGDGPISLNDTKFLFEMQERDDITVVSRGLLDLSKLEPSLWSIDYLGRARAEEFHHKFRRFDRKLGENGFEEFVERDLLVSLKFKDYMRYLHLRTKCLELRNVDPSAEEIIFEFVDHKGKNHRLGVWTSALYMIDLDMKRLFPVLYENFKDSFQLPAILPGGSNCLMNTVTPSARPFMGPNLYVTPPASFTHFHQDGHGTVDSGHLCIQGYNEVVILRRLTERHKKHALWILSGSKPDASYWDGLYAEPHGDGLGEKPVWATNDMISECKKMGYCPSVLILKPGDLIHINKGRLHAFRKLSTAGLPETDCHSQQRKKLVMEEGIAGKEKICVSVAWDWMNRGVTSEGISREVCTVLEGSILNKKNMATSLAIPELCLLQIATNAPGKSLAKLQNESFLADLANRRRETLRLFEPPMEVLCQGILPGLKYLAKQHSIALVAGPNPSTEKGERLRIAPIPDTHENPLQSPLDPYGNCDFTCKLCRMELSNVYYHCDGCEELLNKDFNICQECYKQKEFMCFVQMHPHNGVRKATLNHTGSMNHDRQSKCPCKNGPRCENCYYCLGCSCRCHSWFTVHTRLCPWVQELKIVKYVEEIARAAAGTGGESSHKKLDDRVTLALERLRYARES